jgi:beta-glucanase (GH16 family)
VKKNIKIALAIVTASIVIIGSSGLVYYLIVNKNSNTNPDGEIDLNFDTLVWSDEFDYVGLPTASKWNFEIQGPGWVNNELQNYVKRWENSRVENGVLTLEARLDYFDSEKYSSARITTQYKGDWKYGRIEARAILPGGTGIWPAIWMMPRDSIYGFWPKSGEIDIMEYVGYDPTVVHGSIHTNSYNHLLGTQKTESIIVPTCESQYHVYAIEWYPTNISFFVDDINYYTFQKDADATWEEWPFDEEFYIILNIAVGGFWGGAYGVNDAIFPQQMIIDYVRVYQ